MLSVNILPVKSLNKVHPTCRHFLLAYLMWLYIGSGDEFDNLLLCNKTNSITGQFCGIFFSWKCIYPSYHSYLLVLVSDKPHHTVQ